MGTSPGGLPYPDGTGKVRDGDDAIKALALLLALPEWRQVSGSAATNVPTATWTNVPTPTLAATSGNGAMTNDSGSVLTAAGGLYLVTAYATWSANASGRRIIGITASQATDPPAELQTVLHVSNASTVGMSGSWLIRTPAGTNTRFQLRVYQDSGATLAVNGRGQSVVRLAP